MMRGTMTVWLQGRQWRRRGVLAREQEEEGRGVGGAAGVVGELGEVLLGQQHLGVRWVRSGRQGSQAGLLG